MAPSAASAARRAAASRVERRRRPPSTVPLALAPELPLSTPVPAPRSLAERLRAEAKGAGATSGAAAAAVVTPPATAVPATPSRVPHATGGPTLDELLVGAWEGLSASRTVSCPVCSGAMAPRSGTGRESGAGRCGDCGSELR